MAILKDILYNVSIKAVAGDTAIDVKHIQFDSRKVKQGDLFVAVSGSQVDGHDYIDKALALGATAIICEKLPTALKENITYITTENSAGALGIVAGNYFNNPSRRLSLVGVTGTNGKTTTVTLLHKLFMGLGYKVGMLSTVENKINEEAITATHTTPDAIQLNELLARMVEAGCTHCFMEVSSHALVQHRASGLDFVGGVFTNISHDHLDYHKVFSEYINAKKLLFDNLSSKAFALVNADDKRGMVMLQNTKAHKNAYAIQHIAEFHAKVISNTIQGLELEIEHRNVWFKLIGKFNAYNLLCAYGAAVLMGEDQEEILTILSDLTTAPGRFEVVMNKANVTAIVDYAHTPDALENVLKTIKAFRTGNENVITVVGCGGDRDVEKRPLMAGIACKFSDKVILTSDNPRGEEPEAIIKDMEKGVSPVHYKKKLSIADRREAIKTAVALATDSDIILVAGKGHETYQEIKGVRYDFDDRQVLGEMLNLLKN